MIDPLIFYILFLLLLSAFFSSAESAILSTSESRIRLLNDKILEKLKKNEQEILITILIWNNLVNVLISILTGYFVNKYSQNLSLSIATAIATFLIVTFGEIIPKSLAINLRDRLLIFYSKLLYVFYLVMSPIAKIYHYLIEKIVKEKDNYYTEDELRIILGLTKLKDFERFLVERVLLLDSKTVANILVPKNDVIAISESNNLKAALELMKEHGYSKILTYSGDIDNITGYITLKDILRHFDNLNTKKVKEIKNDIIFLPEYTKVLDAIITFKKTKTPIAAIVDEYGNFLGIITLKDLIEEVFGEIQEIGEIKRKPIVIAEKEIIADGDMTIEDLNSQYGLNLPKNEQYNTIAGLILYKLGRFPKQGEKIKISDNILLIVDKVDKRRIEKVRIRKL